jgi:hypothetical protein
MILDRLQFTPVICLVIPWALFTSPVHAQEPLTLTATATQGSVAAFSVPLNVSARSTLPPTRTWDGGAGTGELRLTGTIENRGNAPVRVVIIAIPEESSNGVRMTRRSVRTVTGTAGAVVLGSFVVGGFDPEVSWVVRLDDHELSDSAALKELLARGSFRIGVVAGDPRARRAVNVALVPSPGVSPAVDPRTPGGHLLDLVLRTPEGRVSVFDAAGAAWGRPIHPGDTTYPLGSWF